MDAKDFGTVEPTEGAALDWNSEIEKESEFVLLPEGEYDFTVVNMERQRHEGSEKMSACPVAKLSLRVESPHGAATIFDRLFLHTKAEWKISAFFGAIGQKKHGEKLKMDWQKVVGSKGRAKFGVRQYNGRDYNEVKNYIYAEDVTPAASGPAWKGGTF